MIYIIGATAEDCGVNDLVKVYMIVGGGLHVLYSVLYGFLAGVYAYNDKSILVTVIGTGANTLLVAMFIAAAICGSIWVWGSFDDWQDRYDPILCDGTTLFVSAITFLVLQYLMIIAACVYLCYSCYGTFYLRCWLRSHEN